MNSVAESCKSSMEASAAQSSGRIEKLLGQGDIEGAQQLSARTIKNIRRSALRREKRLRRIGNACESTLRKMGADGLADEVMALENELAKSVTDAKNQAIAGIKSILS